MQDEQKPQSAWRYLLDSYESDPTHPEPGTILVPRRRVVTRGTAREVEVVAVCHLEGIKEVDMLHALNISLDPEYLPPRVTRFAFLPPFRAVRCTFYEKYTEDDVEVEDACTDELIISEHVLQALRELP
ncbi:hypothetical protein EBT31_06180 [bacterium]|nr:hypothetical protein [bacterium]